MAERDQRTVVQIIGIDADNASLLAHGCRENKCAVILSTPNLEYSQSRRGLPDILYEIDAMTKLRNQHVGVRGRVMGYIVWEQTSRGDFWVRAVVSLGGGHIDEIGLIGTRFVGWNQSCACSPVPDFVHYEMMYFRNDSR